MRRVRRGVLLPQEHRDQERQESEHVPAGTQALTSAALTRANILLITYHPRLPITLIPGALEVRRPSQGLPCIRRRGRRAGAAG